MSQLRARLALPRGYMVNPEMDDLVLVRTARKPHRCAGGHDGSTNTHCSRPIARGEIYIEYVGETLLYQSGARYHVEPCAVQQGLIKSTENGAKT